MSIFSFFLSKLTKNNGISLFECFSFLLSIERVKKNYHTRHTTRRRVFSKIHSRKISQVWMKSQHETRRAQNVFQFHSTIMRATFMIRREESYFKSFLASHHTNYVRTQVCTHENLISGVYYVGTLDSWYSLSLLQKKKVAILI